MKKVMTHRLRTPSLDRRTNCNMSGVSGRVSGRALLPWTSPPLGSLTLHQKVFVPFLVMLTHLPRSGKSRWGPLLLVEIVGFLWLLEFSEVVWFFWNSLFSTFGLLGLLSLSPSETWGPVGLMGYGGRGGKRRMAGANDAEGASFQQSAVPAPDGEVSDGG